MSGQWEVPAIILWITTWLSQINRTFSGPIVTPNCCREHDGVQFFVLDGLLWCPSTIKPLYLQYVP